MFTLIYTNGGNGGNGGKSILGTPVGMSGQTNPVPVGPTSSNISLNSCLKTLYSSLNPVEIGTSDN